MSDNWVVQNLQNALNTWNNKMAEDTACQTILFHRVVLGLREGQVVPRKERGQDKRSEEYFSL